MFIIEENIPEWCDELPSRWGEAIVIVSTGWKNLERLQLVPGLINDAVRFEYTTLPVGKRYGINPVMRNQLRQLPEGLLPPDQKRALWWLSCSRGAEPQYAERALLLIHARITELQQ